MSNSARPTRSSRDVFAIALVGASLLICARAFAWGFDEHTDLGSTGYKAACDDLARELKLEVQPQPPRAGVLDAVSDPCVKPKDDTTARWCLACRTFSPRLYGQSVAIAGDHVGGPEDLWSTEGQTVAASVADYTFLALVNVQHFHPAAPRNWRTFHDKALELATKDYPGGPIARDFAQVFYTSAFADHFLQDAFSAGHAGFNRPSTGAVAAKAFHDIWNQAGRLVRSPTGRCWLQYGDGRLNAPDAVRARFQIDAAEQASVFDVLAAFVTGRRDAGREVRPVYYMPAEITRNPLPGPVWGTRGGPSAQEGLKGLFVGAAKPAAASAATSPAVQQAPVIKEISAEQTRGLTDDTCTVEMDPIDGISNPALINGGVDFWAVGTGDSQTKYGSIDVLYNHRLFTLMSLPVSWEGGLGIGALRRDGRNGWAPSAILGLLSPPLYLAHGLWRNEIGAQAKGYLMIASGPDEIDGYGSVFLRTSIEAATVIVRLQAGPTFDFRDQRFGVLGALGLEFAGTRWITGGGSLKDF